MHDHTITGRATTAFAPMVRRNMLSASDPGEFDEAAVVEPFTWHALGAEERRQAEAASAAAIGLALKGLLHRIDPHTYVAPAQADTPEAAAIATVRDIEERAFIRVAPRLRALAADDLRLARLLQPIGTHIDLRRAAIGVPLPRMIAGVGGLTRVGVGTSEPDAPTGPVVVRDGPAPRFTRMDLMLRAVHRVGDSHAAGAHTTAKADGVVLGGVLVGASGNARVMPSRFIGRFGDATCISLGELPFGQFSLRNTTGYPKTLYGILQLVESDQDDALASRELTRALAAISTLAASTVATPSAGITAASVLHTLTALNALFNADGTAAPYAVRMRLDDDADSFRGGDSGSLRTANILAPGGVYRIGFRWMLNA